MESRYNDQTPVQCEDCDWQGLAQECIHTYKGVPMSMGDVEPVDECPRCGSENLIEIDREYAVL